MHCKLSAVYLYFFLFSVLAMLPNIKINATFERETTAGKQNQPVYSFGISPDSSYVEPRDCVDLVQNGYVVTLEKTISSFEFQYMFQDMSKYVQEKHCGVVGQHQPKTLFEMASATSSQNVTANSVLQQPRMLTEAQACHLPAQELIEFFNLLGPTPMVALRKKFTWTGIQKLIFHLLKTRQQSGLHVELAQNLDRVYKNIKIQSYQVMRNKKNDDSEKLDWFIVSLGLFRTLGLYILATVLQCEYMLIKFRNARVYLRFPVPSIPYVFSRFFFKKETKNHLLLSSLASVEPESHAFPSPLQLPKSSPDLFFLFLCAFEEALWRESWHEVWAYAVELFGFRDYSHHPIWSKYFLYIWGGLAVTCAHLALPQIFTHACLLNTESLATCFSDEIDVLYYKQQVMAAYGAHEQETVFFEQLVALVPHKSKFFVNATFVHLQSKFDQLLKHLLHMWFLRNKHSNDSCDELKSQTFLADRHFTQQCKKHKQFLHQLLSLAHGFSEKEQSRLEEQLFVLEFFLLVGEEIEWGAESPFHGDNGKKEKLDVFFQNTTHFLASFVSFWNNSLAFAQYENELKELKKTCQKQTRLKDNLLWATLGFAHLLLLKFTFNYAPEHFIKDLYQDIYHIFSLQCSTHPMAMLMEKKLTQKRPYHWPAVESHTGGVAFPISSLNLSWFIKNAPGVKNLICLGALSVQRFDVSDQSSYWSE